MAYTLANLQTDIRNYTEVDSTVLTDAIIQQFIDSTEDKVRRKVDLNYYRRYTRRF